MFQNLGRLLTEFYFPEEARQIRSLAAASQAPGASVSVASALQAETSASVSVLGITFEDLGLGIAKNWGLPDNLRQCMRRPAGDPPQRVPDKAPERLRWLALAANEVTDVLQATPPSSPALVKTATSEFAANGDEGVLLIPIYSGPRRLSKRTVSALAPDCDTAIITFRVSISAGME